MPYGSLLVSRLIADRFERVYLQYVCITVLNSPTSQGVLGRRYVTVCGNGGGRAYGVFLRTRAVSCRTEKENHVCERERNGTCVGTRRTLSARLRVCVLVASRVVVIVRCVSQDVRMVKTQQLPG